MTCLLITITSRHRRGRNRELPCLSEPTAWIHDATTAFVFPDLTCLSIGTPNACSGCHVEDQMKSLPLARLKEYADWIEQAEQGDKEIAALVARPISDDACEKWYGERATSTFLRDDSEIPCGYHFFKQKRSRHQSKPCSSLQINPMLDPCNPRASASMNWQRAGLLTHSPQPFRFSKI